MKSLPITAMLKLGKPINATESINEVTEISIFRIDEMVWSAPSSVNFAVEKEEFSRGGFRTAHKATSNSPNFEGKTHVVKHFTKQIAAKVQKDGNKEAYGKMFRYNWLKEELI